VAQQEPTTIYLTPTTKLKGTLSILQRAHYVPRYDRWFDAYAKEWGRRVGVDVRVEHIVPENLVSRALAAIEAGSGHDLIEWISPPSQLEPFVVDLSDLHDEAVRRFGIEQSLCRKAAYNLTTKRYYGYSHAWAPGHGDYRKSLWRQVGMGDGPSPWEELREGGKEFLLNLSANDAVGTYQSELYNLPAFPAMVPQLDRWLSDDPFGSRPSDKLRLLQGAGTWTADIGYPGPSNPAVGAVFTRSILPRMMARAARGRQTPRESVAQAEAEVKRIFDKWRSRGLLGGW
jgi:ABC-type glycerol-3-phosphate transport system substrate-binding protein